MADISLSRLTNIATRSAHRAGDILKKGFGTDYKIGSKQSKHDLVTEYDTRVEAEILSMIRDEFPDHSFLCEESGASGNSDYLWIIDPLDGTVNFAHNIPMFCTSIAVAHKGEIVVGVIYNPMVNELFIAEKGRGATLNGKKLKVTETKKIRDGIVATGFPYNVAENPHHCIDQFAHITKLGIPIRRIGSAAIDLAYVACGRFDGFWEVVLNPWDFAAGTLLVREAGGKVTTMENGEIPLQEASSIIASNTILHDETLEHLSYYEDL